VIAADDQAGDGPFMNPPSIGSFYTMPGSPTVNPETPVVAGNPISEGFPAAPLSSGTTAGTIAITGFVNPAGAITPSTTVPSGAKSATASITVNSQVASVANSSVKITGTGLAPQSPASANVPRGTRMLTVEATILDRTPAKAPIANAAVVFSTAGSAGLGGASAAKINGGTAAALPAAVNATTDASGKASFTVEITGPVTDGAVTGAVVLAARVTSVAGATTSVPGVPPAPEVPTAIGPFTATYENDNVVDGPPASSATVAGLPAGTTMVLANGTPIPVTVTLVDTLGTPAVGIPVAISGPGGSATLPTDASGVMSFTVPGSSTDGSVDICWGIPLAGCFPATFIDYGAAANVTPGSIAVDSFPAAAPDLQIDTKLAQTPATNLTADNVAEVQVRVKNSATTPANLSSVPVMFAVTNGKLVSGPGVLISTGTDTAVDLTNGSGLASVWVASAGTGPVVVTATAGAVSTSSTLTATNSPFATVNAITVAPAAGGAVPASVDAGSTTAMTARVVDVNGNPIAGKLVEINLTGAATLASNGTASATGISNSAGRVNFSVVAGDEGSFTVMASSETKSVTSPSISITEVPDPVTKLVTIGGERNGARTRVQIAGSSEGFPAGTTVTLFVKVRGTSGFTARATQTTNENGEFLFNPRIGKGFTVFARIDTTNSNRILVRAAS
jgi:protocatechuate 3,4-dioxygenase beta subunit